MHLRKSNKVALVARPSPPRDPMPTDASLSTISNLRPHLLSGPQPNLPGYCTCLGISQTLIHPPSVCLLLSCSHSACHVVGGSVLKRASASCQDIWCHRTAALLQRARQPKLCRCATVKMTCALQVLMMGTPRAACMPEACWHRPRWQPHLLK